MAAETIEAPQASLDILNNIQAKGQTNTLTDDINNYIPSDLSPEAQAAMQAQNNPSTGQLPLTAYYPDANHNVAVGHYSGDQIGSTTLFAPGGGLVPLGMMDARDAAANKAAMQKAKEIEDFKNKYQAPTTKHVAVQKNLTDRYYEGLQKWNQNALQKAGGNQSIANKMLENDPKFSAWNKSMQDVSKFHDAVVDHSAQLHADEKDPNFVMSPELKKMDSDILSGVAYLEQNPFDERGHNLSRKFLAAKAQYDLEKSTNEAIDKAIPNIEQLDPTFQTRGKNETATYLEKEFFTPEARQQIAENLYMDKYQGTGITQDQVQRLIDAKLGEKIRRKTDTYDKWFKPDSNAGKESTYESVAPQTKTAFNVNAGTETSPDVKSIHAEKVYKTSATDEKKAISIPVSKDMQDVQGKKIGDGTGNVKGTVSSIHLGLYDKNSKQYLTEDQAKHYEESGVKSHNIIKKPVAILNLEPSADEKEAGEKGNTVLVDASEIKGKFKNPHKKQGQQDFDDKITELENDAHAHNESVKAAAKTAKAKPAVKVEDLRKKYNY